MHPLDILRRPIVTEKSTLLQEAGKYTFQVDGSASKIQIKEAVEKAFNVKVRAVNTIRMPGKKRFSRRVRGTETRTKPWKKAIVTLAPGQTIELFTTP